MENSDKKIRWRNILIWILFLISTIMIMVTFVEYSIDKNYTMVDRIPCLSDTTNCFVSEYEGEDPYKIILLKEPAVLNCTEKDESCDIENICENISEDKCKVIDCKDDLTNLPKGYDISGACFE